MPQQAGAELGIRGAIDRARGCHGPLEEHVESGMVASQKIREGSRHQGRLLLKALPSPPRWECFIGAWRYPAPLLLGEFVHLHLHLVRALPMIMRFEL